ncbi:class I SAM-dependent methyltransferase [Dethiosulfatarculus sandiegensis]|uniref:Methyltransferase domain-containing protein n=1 Tax=Dethiosulfatarculus sandiegensis TaxID=1429043 RepID=A0A0D2JAB7_9BACT|nr:class I SAM-dependent methyltransferase [Dethiosulfatarculus sandiegensis]KIX12676.1 hypothetical protein X474_17995 [Dethiosulfatarculus sandiegensis]
MSTSSGAKVTEKTKKAFWENLARHYPLPFDKEVLATTQKVFSMVKKRGVTFSNAEILDIACGTGIYTLPLAGEAAGVTGLDDSEAMLDRMKQVMEAKGIQNVRPVKASWEDIDIAAKGFQKAFDIAWVSMTPAIQTAHDFDLMEQCARKWCVYIGWGRKRENALMQEIFSSHGLSYGPPPNIAKAYDILLESGRKPSLDYFETTWYWKGTANEALSDIAFHIEMHGEKPRRDLIAKALHSYERDGVLSYATEVELRLLVWPV